MGKGRPRAVEKGVLGQNSSVSLCGSLNIPSGPVYYPSEDEFREPLEYIDKIRAEAEPYGICRIVPPKNWKPPFALDLDSFQFPTKTQAIHRLQARPASCDSKTFELEYNRFLEDHCGGKKVRSKVVWEGEELDLCKLFNAVKRYGGYNKVAKEKKWVDVSRFMTSARKVSECAKHVLSQLYLEHLYDYEEFYNQLNQGVDMSRKRGLHDERRSECKAEISNSKKKRKNNDGKKVKAEEEEEEHDQICEQCNSGFHGEVMLLCDRCNKGWHIYCLSPPLKQVPQGNWYCLDCLNSDKDSFGFVPGKKYTIESFRRVADRAKKKWFGAGPTSRMLIEKKFWEIVEGSLGEVEVMYGSDLDTSVYGSGFPRVDDKRPESIDAKVWDEYCNSPWNLNNLPKLRGSVLRAVDHNIAGVMVPWLYMGMQFSSFCWHFEDHCFYSMNYLHWGEPKCWYSVPGSAADAFEKVMRNCLPDLFDAEPDLLFQLVTMLNPSVLQENEVPVYSVLQEPGNFVITFPRSYHGGFNLGLNCAEAVNFAPADWLPHGRFGAELYQLYRKTAVLSHDELLCVLAKQTECDSKVAPYLKKELHRVYAKEKTWRERLWKNGVVKSSPMPPRKCPEYIGTEEDSTCIICKQYLYLSAVSCRCRPSALVCLEHWERLCECKSSRRRLLYRHSLAELNELVLEVDQHCSDETIESRKIRRQSASASEPTTLIKKVKGGQVSLNQLAEQWLRRSGKIFQNTYSRDIYVVTLKEAQQFLWAGSEMDPVREMAKDLAAARKWAECVRKCVSRGEKWSRHERNGLKRVSLEYVCELLSANPPPCNEPKHIKLKEYAEEARVLVEEINKALLATAKIYELEPLYSRVRDLPVYVKESKILLRKISSAKVWLENVRKCISKIGPAAVEVEYLYKLNSEILELNIEYPETEVLSNLLKLADSCRARCEDILKHPINLQNVEVFLQEMNNFTVNFPELKLLRQYHADAVSWISRFNDILHDISEREDQHNVVAELTCILKDGASLNIQVDELPLVEVELQKAYCRIKALKARDAYMTVDFLRQLLTEARLLHIEGEKLFVSVSEIIVAATHWEEMAAKILANRADISAFEDAIRDSENIWVILPLLNDVKEEFSMATSWLTNVKPYLVSCSSLRPASSSLLRFDVLQDLVSQSKLLKVSLKERKMLETVLKDCDEWKKDACSLLEETAHHFDITDICGGLITSITLRTDCLVTRIESVVEKDVSFGVDLDEIPKLEDACSTLQWCKKALSFCSTAPSFEDVENLMKSAELHGGTFASSVFWNLLVDGVKWLRRASKAVSLRGNPERCKLSEAEQILSSFQHVSIYPIMFGQLEDAIQKHMSWIEQVQQFLNLEVKERSWSEILQLKDVGVSTAFSCSELDLVLSEVEKVEKWKQSCMGIFGTSIEEKKSLLGALRKIKRTLETSLYIYGKSSGMEVMDICPSCSSNSQNGDFLACSICKDCYHLRCLGPAAADVKCAEVYTCPYCRHWVDGSSSLKGGGPLRFAGKRLELKLLIELLSNHEDFCVCIEEREVLKDLVDKALTCKMHTTEIVDFALAYIDKDLCTVSGKLTAALKATEVAGVFNGQVDCSLKVAVARNLWKLRVKKLMEGSRKPTMQQIQQHLKECLTLNIPPEDHFRQKLAKAKRVSLHWADHAKKVAADSGSLSLDKVFDLIAEGENLPVQLEKELKLLRARSMLYCICRKPYDQRAMIACDKCDEWYHFDCINLVSAPKIYICPACEPLNEEESANHKRLLDAKFVEPKTPSPKHTKSRKKPKKANPDEGGETCSSGIERLWWRNRKPFRRAAKKRSELQSLSFFHSSDRVT